MNLTCYPYDFEYKVKNGKVYVYLYSKTEDNRHLCVVHEYYPFFYVKVPERSKEQALEKITNATVTDNQTTARVRSVIEVEREYIGQKEQFWQVYVSYPKAVPLFAKEFQQWGLECFEKDILFVHRYLRDLGITPLQKMLVEGQAIDRSLLDEPASDYSFFLAEKITPGVGTTKWKILAVDIETYAEKKEIDPEKNPILMIGLSGIDEENNEFQRVITWKQFPHEYPYIEHVADEQAMLQRFQQLLTEYNPEIITGYFSDGFDLPYLKTRSLKYNLSLDFQVFSKSGFRSGEVKVKNILHLDMLKFVKQIFGLNLKTDSYTLDAVAQELLGHSKHKVNLDNLAGIWDNEPEKIAQYCAYNLHDALLTRKLCEKLLSDILEFTSIVGLPPFDVTRMRFSKLVENYILKRAIEFNVVAPNKAEGSEMEERMEESIQGAFVFQPTPGLYQDIVVFDFRSLYPTIISAHNLGPEAFRCSCCQDQEHVPEKEDYWFCRCEKKFIPLVLDDLITKRTAVKKQLKEEKKTGKDVSMLEARTYALKILANAFYGYLGFFGARWYCLECAAATTAYARDYIKKTIKKAEQNGFGIVYGDSLPPDRKIFMMNEKDEIELISIGDFVDQNGSPLQFNKYKTLAFDGTKLIFSPITKVIRHGYSSLKKGKLLRFITTHGTTVVTPQHSVYKLVNGKPKLVNALTLKEGDSLVSLTGISVKENYHAGHIFDLATMSFGPFAENIFSYKDTKQFPPRRGNCPYCHRSRSLASHVHSQHDDRKIGLQSLPSLDFQFIGTKHGEGGKIPRFFTLNSELAWILGFYCAEGSASYLKTTNSWKSILSFGSQDRGLIERVKQYFDTILQENFKIVVNFDQRINKNMYYYRVQRIPIVALFVYGFGCGKGSSGKTVPPFIYSSEEIIRQSFIKGYLDGDGNKTRDLRYYTHFVRFDTKSKDLASGVQYLLKSLTHGKTYFGKEIKHVGWRYRKDKPSISSLRLQGARGVDKGNYIAAKIKEIKEESYEGSVYDLEVETAHNFVDAEGLLLVHNTDSVFLLLGKKNLDEAKQFMDEINVDLPGQMELECESYYPRGLFVAVKGTDLGAKKKYALLRENGSLKIVGFETVRRNWSFLAKEIQEKVLQLVLEDKAEEAFTQVKRIVAELKEGKVDLHKLVIKTQITRELHQYTSLGPHVLVAKRLEEKGERVFPGMVVEYVIAAGSGLVRDRAQLREDVKSYDADYYIGHQVIPAVLGILHVFGYTEDDILGKGKQMGLGKFF
ncbi:ribonuclease H-like domain-containing protein [Candidatus Woesearchaeota archaeon]|nr:ribonuclease H-like domain-containing protein [Candidatus Woesearchaeota archaeon]